MALPQWRANGCIAFANGLQCYKINFCQTWRLPNSVPASAGRSNWQGEAGRPASYGVLARAAQRGLVDINNAVERLRATDFRCTPTLFQVTKQRAREQR